jgi:hypothetical protein
MERDANLGLHKTAIGQSHIFDAKNKATCLECMMPPKAGSSVVKIAKMLSQ